MVDLIYVKNLVDGICLALETPAASNRLYNIADEAAYTWEQFTRCIHRALGRRAMTVKVPGPLLTAAGWVGQRAAWWTGGEMKLNDQKVREMKEPYWRLSTELVREHLGYRPRFSVERAVSETLEWYRHAGWL
jgi:nucleoside-diphosphate-sugar epimerase